MASCKLVVIVVVTFLIGSSVVIAESGKKYPLNLDSSPGDFFEYSVDTTGLVQSMIDDSEGDIIDIEVNAISVMRVYSPAVSCVELTGDCHRSTTHWQLDLTTIYEEGSGIDNDRDVVIITFDDVTEANADGRWTESTTALEAWMTIDGENYHFESVAISEKVTTPEETSPSEVSEGDSWTTREVSTVLITDRNRLNEGDWDVEVTEETWENTTNWNAESTGSVFVGGVAYDSIKIVSQEVGSANKEVVHYSEHGFPVKMEKYDDLGELEVIMTLTDYQYRNEPEPESETGFMEGLPGFGLMAAISMLSMAAIFNRNATNI